MKNPISERSKISDAKFFSFDLPQTLVSYELSFMFTDEQLLSLDNLGDFRIQKQYHVNGM